MNRIDIVLTYYNGSKFIRDQIESIEKNSIPKDISIRLIIVDDASTNEESLFLTNICKDKPFVEYLKNDHNLGVMKSLEIGISKTDAPYVMLADQDDYWLENKIALSLAKIEEIEKDSPALVFTDLVIVDENLKEIFPSMIQRYNYKVNDIHHSLLIKNVVTGCTVIINRKLIEVAFPLPSSIPMHDHWLALCASYFGHIGYLNKPTILYRQHSCNQIGAPRVSTIYKIFHVKELLDRYAVTLNQKIAQVRDLWILSSIHKAKINPSFLVVVVSRLERLKFRDLLYLYQNRVIHNALLPLILSSISRKLTLLSLK